MSISAKLVASTIIGSVLTGVYWLAFFALAYGLTGGDYRPGTGPSDGQRQIAAIVIWAMGFVVYAGLAWAWRRIDFRLADRTRS